MTDKLNNRGQNALLTLNHATISDFLAVLRDAKDAETNEQALWYLNRAADCATRALDGSAYDREPLLREAVGCVDALSF